MRHAHVDEVPHTCMKRRSHCFPARDQIDAPEFGGFGRTGMSNADQLYERCSLDRVPVRVRVKRISRDDFAAERQFSLRSRTYKRSNTMTTGQQARNEVTSYVSGASRNKYGLC